MFKVSKLYLLLICLTTLGLLATACAAPAAAPSPAPAPAATQPAAAPAEPAAATEPPAPAPTQPPSPPTEAPATAAPTTVPEAPAPTAAVTTTAPSGAKPVRLALFHTVLGNTYTKAVSDGVMDSAKKAGATVDVFGADPAFDAVAQSHQIQDAITSKKYDAFVIYACDGNAVVTDVKDAIAAGIKVVAADVVIGPDARTYEPCCGIVSYVGRTGIDHGTFLGNMIVQACSTVTSKPCKVGYLNGAQALTIDQDRVEAINKVLASHPDVQIVANQEALYLQDKGYEVAQNMLQAHPDINVLATSGDQMMLGAEQAVNDAGLKGKILLLGNGTGERGYQAIKEGRFWSDYADIPYTMGQIAGDIAIKAVRGEPVPKSVKNDEQKPPLPPDGPIITQKNADQFKPQW